MSGRAVRLVLLALLAAITIVEAGQALGQITFGATLTVIGGRVSVVRADGTAVAPASSGLTLNEGDRVGTIGKSAALVTFFDGSELELGADTTIKLQKIEANSSGQITIVLENVLGSTLHLIATLSNPGSSYQIIAGGSVALVRGTELGHRVDGTGNVTVFLISSSNTVTFPNPSNQIHDGQVCTYTAAGDILCGNAKGADPWGTLANGDGDGAGNTSTRSSEKDTKVVTSTTTTSTTTEVGS